MLSAEQRDAFAQDGLVKIAQAVPAEHALTMAARIGEHLETEESVRRNDAQAWLAERPAGLRALTDAGVFDTAAAENVAVALGELHGTEPYPRPKNGGRALVTRKVSDAPWDVPADGWHVDAWPGPHGEEPLGVTVFTVLAPLRPFGGGTLILAGSYRLLRTGLSSMVGTNRLKAVRRELGARHPWLRELWNPVDGPGAGRRAPYLDEGEVLDGVPLRVVELTGEPGDAFIMRADTFHTLAPNSLDAPRMMLVKTWSSASGHPDDD